MEKIKNLGQEWRDAHKEESREYNRKKRLTPERKQYLKEFRKRNKENNKCSDQKHNWDQKVKVLRLVAKGGPIQCVKCGIKDKRILQIHHINGNGERDRKLYYKTNVMIRTQNHKEKINVEELEIRCCNCNILAEYEELNRRYSNIAGFDENFDPIWKILPKTRKPLEPMFCDMCGIKYIPRDRKKRINHFCSKNCYTLFMKKNSKANKCKEGKIENKTKPIGTL